MTEDVEVAWPEEAMLLHPLELWEPGKSGHPELRVLEEEEGEGDET